MAQKSRIWNFFDGLKGDKVVWMIVLTLIMCSAVCIFSSTSTTKEVMSGTQTRVDVMVDLIKVIIFGIVLLLVCYNFIGVKGYRVLAQLGFPVSALLLLVVVTHFDSLPFFKAGQINGAWRVIKIDRSFMPTSAGLEGDEERVEMLKTLIGLTHTLGIECLAEGVETMEQIVLLKTSGCMLAQGYYFDRPMPGKQFAEKLLEIKGV